MENHEALSVMQAIMPALVGIALGIFSLIGIKELVKETKGAIGHEGKLQLNR